MRRIVPFPFVPIVAAVVLVPSLAAADGRFGANAGVDTGHGSGKARHQGVFVRLPATHRLGLELELERITPFDDARGQPATGFGADLVYQLTPQRRTITPLARAGGGVEPSASTCQPSHVRADVGLGAELELDRAVYLGADLRFTRRWEDDSACVFGNSPTVGPSYKRSPGDPWDDVALRLSLSIGF